jgi:hypothetical protein
MNPGGLGRNRTTDTPSATLARCFDWSFRTKAQGECTWKAYQLDEFNKLLVLQIVVPKGWARECL